MRSTRSSLRRANATECRAPVWDEAHARMIAGLPPKRSPIVPLTLAISFLVSCGIGYYQNGVIRDQADTLAKYESGAKSPVKSYESASLRASMALAAYDRCVGLRGVSAP